MSGAARLPPGVTVKLLAQLLSEIGPLLVFFLVFTWFGFFIAAGAYALATAVSFVASWYRQRRLPILPLISTVLVAIFAGLTVLLDDTLFLKIKPTVINAFYALLIGGGWLLGFRIVRRVLGGALHLDDPGERQLTLRVTLYLACLALANEIVWREASLETWVLFKVFVLTAANLAFGVLQLPLIRRHRVERPSAAAPAEALRA